MDNNIYTRKSREMNDTELANWWALCNALKFVNHTAKARNVIIDEKDLDYRELLNYISAVSGDVATCIKAANGVPFKYSLVSDTEDSYNTDDLSYEFLG